MQPLADYQVFAFDMDGTITDSNLVINDEMRSTLVKLSQHKVVAIISGASLEHMEHQLLLDSGSEEFETLHLLPGNGGLYFRLTKGVKQEVWRKTLSTAEIDLIVNKIKTIMQLPEFASIQPTGEQIEVRSASSVNIKFLGSKARYEDKLIFDPNQQIRNRFVEQLGLENDFSVKIGGNSTIDITPRNVDKAQSLTNFLTTVNHDKRSLIYFGDALYPNGNDEVVKNAGFDTVAVSGWQDTVSKLSELLD